MPSFILMNPVRLLRPGSRRRTNVQETSKKAASEQQHFVRSPVKAKSQRILEKKRSLSTIIQASTRSIGTMETTLTRSSTFSSPSSTSVSSVVSPSSTTAKQENNDSSRRSLSSSNHNKRESNIRAAAAVMGGTRSTPLPPQPFMSCHHTYKKSSSASSVPPLGKFLNSEFQDQGGRLETVGERSICTEGVRATAKNSTDTSHHVHAYSNKNNNNNNKRDGVAPPLEEKKRRAKEEPSPASSFRRSKPSLLDDDDDDDEPPPSPLFAPRRIRPQLNRGGQFVPPSLKSTSNHTARTSSTVSLNATSNHSTYMSSKASILISEYEGILNEYNDSARSLLVEDSSVCSAVTFGTTAPSSFSIPGPPPLSQQSSKAAAEMPDLDRMSSADALVQEYEQILNDFKDSCRSLLAAKEDFAYSSKSLLAPPSPMPELRRNGSGFASVTDMTSLLTTTESCITGDKNEKDMDDEKDTDTDSNSGSGSIKNNKDSTPSPPLTPKISRPTLKSSKPRPMLTRGGAVKCHQESYFGRSTRNLLGDFGSMLDDYDDILDEFNDSTRSVQRKERKAAEEKQAAAAASSSLLSSSSSSSPPSSQTANATRAHQQSLQEATGDEDDKLPVPKLLTGKPRPLLNRGGAVPMTYHAAFFHRSTKELISEYDAILTEFNDSAAKFGSDDDKPIDYDSAPPPSLVRNISKELQKKKNKDMHNAAPTPSLPRNENSHVHHHDPQRSKRCII